MSGEWEGGKGSRPRPYKVQKYLDNYDRIFGNDTEEGKEPEGNQPEHQHRDGGGQTKESGDSHCYVKGEA